MSAGVGSLIASAASGRKDEGFTFLLDGDLMQMRAQEKFLKGRGMKVGRWDCYPALSSQDDFNQAIKLIWENKIEGWWHYKAKLVAIGACTAEEFDKALYGTGKK